jgi:hypothetical protein
MAMDQIDREYRELMTFMHAEQQVDDLLNAIRMIIAAEKMDEGLVRRQFVADALGQLICSLPAAWASVIEANPELTADYQRQSAIRVALAMLFDSAPDNNMAIAAGNEFC